MNSKEWLRQVEVEAGRGGSSWFSCQTCMHAYVDIGVKSWDRLNRSAWSLRILSSSQLTRKGARPHIHKSRNLSFATNKSRINLSLLSHSGIIVHPLESLYYPFISCYFRAAITCYAMLILMLEVGEPYAMNKI